MEVTEHHGCKICSKDLYLITNSFVLISESVPDIMEFVTSCSVCCSFDFILILHCSFSHIFAGFSSILPASQTVGAYDIAFFPCEVPNKGQPLWVINTTEYFSSNLIEDHTTNVSGLLVHARPEYNNTVYQCRFVDFSVTQFGFFDIATATSPQAMRTISG